MSPVVIARLYDYLALASFVVRRRGELRRPALREQVARQVFASGITALPVIAALAVLAGAATATQLGTLIGPDSELTQRLLFVGVYYELAPLLTALVVVARSSAGIASELAVMKVHDEYAALHRLGVPPADFLLLPRVVGLAAALPALAVCFQALAIASGWFAVALVDNRPLLESAQRFLDLSNPLLVLLGIAKCTTTGAAIGVVACHHGSSGNRSTQAVSAAAMQAVGSGLVAVFVIDVVFAVIAYVLR